MIARGDLPRMALSVRQPWAWAIIHGGKDIENRSDYSVRVGNMVRGPIAIHAAQGMKQDEYDWAVWRMAQDGVVVPRPDVLVRSAIIGCVEVVDFVTESASPWFGGPVGLVLRNPRSCTPIPSAGARGYFEWSEAGDIAAPLRWMRDWGGGEGGLFDALAPSFRDPPAKPFGKRQARRVDR